MTCRRRLAPALALVVATAVGGCARSAATETGPAAAESPPAAASAASTTSAPFSSGEPVPPPLDDAGPTEPEAAPAPPDPAAAEQARTRATAFLRAFARTDLDQQAWWNGVADYFTPAAAAIYRSTDVANVPVHTVEEGSARLLPDTTRYRAEVTVGTDIGTYTVVLLRADDDWLVDRAVPPTP
jgi:hypothetical protein